MPHSENLYQQALKHIPGGVNSPVRAFKGVSGTPIFMKKGHGPYLYDVDDKRYIDYICSWGPMILGHAHPAVIKAVENALKNSLGFGTPTELEVLMAEKISELMPNIESVRMVNSGTEATMSAIRLARAVTGRDKIIKFAGCYHGHSDSLLVNAGSGALTLGVPSSPGVPKDLAQHTLTADFNDLPGVRALFDTYPEEIACVIVEPIVGNMNLVKPESGFLSGLRKICNGFGAVLIFDEVMTGFRVARGGAQELYGVKPDLTTLGKVIGGGLPVGAFGGRRDIMEQMAPAGPVYQAGTLSGNPLAMAAGLAQLNQISADETFFERLENYTQALVQGMIKIAESHDVPFYAQYVCGMFGFYFMEEKMPRNLKDIQKADLKRFQQFFHLMLQEGVYLAPSMYEAGFISIAHDEKIIAETLNAMENAFNKMKISAWQE